MQLNAPPSRIILLCATLVCAYFLGAYSYGHNLWPINSLRHARAQFFPVQREDILGTYDDAARLTSYPGKAAVACPAQDARTAVILAIGQSNIANHTDARYTPRHTGKVINYFDGQCYEAASPLLGASGERGEFLTEMADELIDAGHYDRVVLVSSGIGGALAARWQRYGDLNDMLMRVVEQLTAGYAITHVIWHQGEADYRESTAPRLYRDSFASMLASLNEWGVVAPVFIAIATKCGVGVEWARGNKLAKAQEDLVDNNRVFLGVNTDKLDSSSERQDDFCHLSATGQHKVARAYADAMGRYESSK